MKIVGLTGGIGSGKTTVAKAFEALGIPIYIADIEAKALMNSSKEIYRELTTLLGEAAYKDGVLNRVYIADRIFKDKALLEQMNAIVHPRVAEHFKTWLAAQTAPYVIKEVAILFENGSYQSCDLIITVTAPIEVRIERVMARDQANEGKVRSIMANQWSDEEKIKRSDFVIENIDLKATTNQVHKIHTEILNNIM